MATPPQAPTNVQTFEFEAVGKSKGVIHWLGTGKGEGEWANPDASGEVEVCMSSICAGRPSMVVDHEFWDQVCFTNNENGSWIGVDLKTVELCPTAYAFAHRAGLKDFMVRSWWFQGSEDGSKWDELDDRFEDETMTPEKPWAAYAIRPTEKYYRYFRVQMQPQGNTRRTDTLVLSCFELYGKTRRAKDIEATNGTGAAATPAPAPAPTEVPPSDCTALVVSKQPGQPGGGGAAAAAGVVAVRLRDTHKPYPLGRLKKEPKESKYDEPLYDQGTYQESHASPHPAGQTTFTWHHTGDKHGIIFYIGTGGGQHNWVNPFTHGAVEVTASSLQAGNLAHVVDHTLTTQVLHTRGDAASSWICVDLLSCRVRPTAYSMAHRADRVAFFARNWQFQGSNDGRQWATIHAHHSDYQLSSRRRHASWKVNCPDSTHYRMFRVLMNGHGNCQGTNQFSMCCFDLYGTVIPA
eukprot:TRINITY_DN399_c1_g2_i1.p2 TRINITY_DN399_c1_g2~~TRINITY_DN399_c1_g2_i1.p2  ORF type:complete len:489 (+),score=161.52 TRINITY_DN399_c1_g2_i1:76-1467(+)